ncbi:metal-dependent hydrolase family protein [Thalassotalea crassostreae]|uniref:metal-dependent hydrolase family protein n=1 Tax=Thalassotalea crassostreae TaxID=1763536 RepID=UPI0009EF01A1|nr:amidohydrolase family protein [Thalassotalea crassostreae]
MKVNNVTKLAAVISAVFLSTATVLPSAVAAGAAAPVVSKAPIAGTTLFTNVNVFNGTENKLYKNLNVLVEGKIIKSISKTKPAVGSDVVLIDGEGRTLMPGMIDSHVHLAINSLFSDLEQNSDHYDIAYRGVPILENTLEDGFTSVRDMGGPVFGMARAVNNGTLVGPRIYPSGAFLSQTSGHGDFRDRSDVAFTPKNANDNSNFENLGFGAVVDGVPEALRATRTNLRNGATQIKIMAGGGGSSKYDPLDVTQFSVEETCAIVETTKDWNTYVGAHIFTDRAINRSLDCGVKTFEHGFFASKETYERMAKEGAYVVPQFWALSPALLENPNMPADKLPLVKQLLKKYADVGKVMLDAGVKIAFQSDYLGTVDDGSRARRYEIYASSQMLGKGDYNGNFETLKSLTSVPGEMLAMSGPRNPAPGKLGVIEVGATADILLIDGNPLEDIGVLNGGYTEWYSQPAPSETPIETIDMVMKEGVIYRNDL